MKVLYRDEDCNLIVLMRRDEWNSAAAAEGYPEVGAVAEVLDLPAMERRLANAATAITETLARKKMA